MMSRFVVGFLYGFGCCAVLMIGVCASARADQVILDDGTSFEVPDGHYVAILPDYVTQCIGKFTPVPIEPEKPCIPSGVPGKGCREPRPEPPEEICIPGKGCYERPPGYKWGR